MRLPAWLRPGRAGGRGLPPGWRDVLTADFAQWRLLTPEEQARCEHLMTVFLRRTRIEAARGFRVDDRVRVLVAAQACLLLLGLDLDHFPGSRTVIVHRSTVVLDGRRSIGVGRVEASGPYALSGQAHYQGPVLLSWVAVLGGARFPHRGQNVVMHEFAHSLDMLDGTVDGTPPLDDPEARRRWIEVCTAAYDQVRAGSADSVLRGYAGTNPGEFFAVATEVFFTKPHELREQEPALYAELVGFYRQDPASRAPAPVG